MADTASAPGGANGGSNETASNPGQNQANQTQKGADGDRSESRLRHDAQGQPGTTQGNSEGAGVSQTQESQDRAQAEAWLKNKRKIKVNGTEREVTAEEAFERYSLPQAAYERMEKAAALEKQYRQREQQLQQLVRENPVELLRRVLGPQQARQVMEQAITRDLEWDMKSPHERERMTLEQERQQFMRQKAQYEQRVKQLEVTQSAQRLKGEYSQSFPRALEAAGIAATPDMVREMAAVAQNMLKAGIKWTPEEAAKVVADNEREREQRIMRNRMLRLEKLSDEELHAQLKKDYGSHLNRFRKADVSEVNKFHKQAPEPEVSHRRPQEPQRPISIDDLREKIAQRRGG